MTKARLAYFKTFKEGLRPSDTKEEVNMKLPMIKKEEGCQVIIMRIHDHSKRLFNRCHCGARFGDRHRNMCDSERCPHCSGQFINCGCDVEDEDRIPWLNT